MRSQLFDNEMNLYCHFIYVSKLTNSVVYALYLVISYIYYFVSSFVIVIRLIVPSLDAIESKQTI
jgi:hypothetical protein